MAGAADRLSRRQATSAALHLQSEATAFDEGIRVVSRYPAEERPLRFNGFQTWSPRKYCQRP